ncbi:MAG: hypothetical protein CLLPBCKN_002185 [Chroococcidiopsis cubana SAG 39.79]|jgi:hypothetical protein|uniref:Transposase n=1 Tax=Chroococcidiopsis cubana SAG 39.79 TaxID=388085 RepID=A0AB37UER5_9CYAN|nr:MULTISPECIES: hypothetical protein [Chroococcidiopsis]MDZ4872789.1 hypothetical protein [Chroococcidiopsis cubana SAG 39.79]PSB63599.1 hypothetical protein C7B79_13220 [Chroococcidiopsis cubana CCALA 043]PSM51081.1 hypothetical protein C7Y66_00935 [Chroococcidiopsis sp. CCALA 051]RUT09281.1 hypothetical protein DSM107010_45770 [Chroococcidiopsis cubana SAG 39.79]
MIATENTQAKYIHPLARFVTKEAIALCLNLQPEQIYKIDCWRYVIHVVGKGVSTFVSYADLPPILGVEPPTNKDFFRWRKRFAKHKKQAPQFWEAFYQQKLQQAASQTELDQWKQILQVIEQILPSDSVAALRTVFEETRSTIRSYRLPTPLISYNY